MTPLTQINNAIINNKNSTLDINMADINFLPFIEIRLQNIEEGDYDKYDILDETSE